VVDYLLHGGRMKVPPYVTCPEALYEAILSCWNDTPMDRPTFAYMSQLLKDFDVGTEGQYQYTGDEH